MSLSNVYSKLRGDLSGQKNEDSAQVRARAGPRWGQEEDLGQWGAAGGLCVSEGFVELSSGGVISAARKLRTLHR